MAFVVNLYWKIVWRLRSFRRCESCRTLGFGRGYASTCWGCGIMCEPCVEAATRDFYGYI
jgi:hypothetical protein